LFSECRRACDSASTRPSRCGQRPCRKFCSQIRRQSVRHSPWHLNSLPGPPILPPHPGHTQFRMPDITSPLPTTVVQFIFIDCISTSRKRNFRASTFRRQVPGIPLAPSGCQRSHTLSLNAFPVPNERSGSCVPERHVNYIYATEFCPAASERYMAMCREQQSPSQSRLLPFHHSAVKAAHALCISETDRLAHYS
jgi:hypothetical protein